MAAWTIVSPMLNVHLSAAATFPFMRPDGRGEREAFPFLARTQT